MRRSVLVFIAAGLAGCPGGTVDPPGQAPPIESFGSCVIREGSTAETAGFEDGPIEVSLHGFIVDQGTGSPAEGCLDVNAWTTGDSVDDADGFWLVVEDGEGDRFTVAGRSGGAQPDPYDAEVYVSWTWDGGLSPLGGTYGATELVIEDFESATVAYVADSTGLQALDVPNEFSVTRGPEVARTNTECYVAVDYAIDVAVGDQQAQLDFGESASLAGFLIVHGGTREEESTVCSETAGSSTHIAITR